jgi:hypothetical protein
MTMSEGTGCDPKSVGQIRADLENGARLLREATHLDPQVQTTLADLLDELKNELDPAVDHSVHVANLAGIVAKLGEALHEPASRGIVAGLRNRLNEAFGRAEVEAPVISEVARKFVDALASIGI